MHWGSGTVPVSSVVLLAHGIGIAVRRITFRILYALNGSLPRDDGHRFQIVAIILTAIGPAADYGSTGRWLLLVQWLP